jgi:hypothetical protein
LADESKAPDEGAFDFYHQVCLTCQVEQLDKKKKGD